MNSPNFRKTAALRSVSTLGIVLACACAHAAGTTAQPMAACRSIADVAARVSCYDHLADQQAQGAVQPAQSPAQVTQPSPEPTGTAEQHAMTGQQRPQELHPYASSAASGADADLRERPHVAPRKQVLLLESITRTPSGKLLIVTREGSTWVQSDEQVLRNLPKPGSQITVRPGALGSYFCVLQHSAWIRCKPRR